jgi:lipoyl(octanoyl) transferase 2
MRLAHLHLPTITLFTHVSQLQHTLTTRLLAYKKEESFSRTGPNPPDPTILTFTPNPVYTTGRRELLYPSATPSPSARSAASGPETEATLLLPPSLEPIRWLLARSPAGDPKKPPIAEYHATLRGGQTTYHGPGQLVAYTILDLRRLGLTPRCQIRLLENSVIDVLRGFGVRGFVTDDPGVWVSDHHQHPAGDRSGAGDEPKKIAAVGVHLRRHISSYGVGLNVTREPLWFFRQIVACGLKGREATCLVDHLPRSSSPATGDIGMDAVAGRFVDAFVQRLNANCADRGGAGERIDAVYRIREEDVLPLLSSSS